MIFKILIVHRKCNGNAPSAVHGDRPEGRVIALKLCKDPTRATDVEWSQIGSGFTQSAG